MIGSFSSIIPLLISLLLGLAIGIERTCAGKTAGMRTYALVSVCATLLVLIATTVAGQYGANNVDILRVVAAIISGVGFLGAGLIVFKNDHVSNLTTAAGIWFTAGIGVAVGFGMHIEAIMATFISLFIFFVLARVEKVIKIGLKK